MTEPATDSVEALLEADAAVASPGFAHLTRTSAVFALGAVLGKVVGLVLLPVLTRLLTPAEYGSMDVLMSLGTALTAGLLLGLDVAALRLYFDQPDREARRRLFGTWYAIALAVTVVAGIVVALESGNISSRLFPGAGLQPAVLAISVIVVAQTLQVIALTVLRAEGRAGWYAAISGGVLVLYAALAVWLLHVWQADANAVLVAWALALVIAAIVGALLVRREAFGRPAVQLGRALLWLGLPLAPAVAASLGADFVNRTILLTAGGAADVAYFTVAVRFASVAGLAVAAFQLAWQPRAYAMGRTYAAGVRLAADARWIVAIVCAVVVALAVAGPELVTVAAGAQYITALPALGFSLVAVLGAALYLVASLPSAVVRMTRDLAVATGVAVAVAVVGNLVLAPLWHSTGTAAAVAAGQFGAVVVVGWLGLRRWRLPVDWARIGALVTVTAVSALACTTLVGNGQPIVRLILGIATFALIAWSVPLGRALAAMHRTTTR